MTRVRGPNVVYFWKYRQCKYDHTFKITLVSAITVETGVLSRHKIVAI